MILWYDRERKYDFIFLNKFFNVDFLMLNGRLEINIVFLFSVVGNCEEILKWIFCV